MLYTSKSAKTAELSDRKMQPPQQTPAEFEEKCLEYEEVKLAIKELEAKASLLKEEITPYIQEDQKINCASGAIEVKRRDNWHFSEGTQLQEKALKEAQEEEIAKGVATSTPTIYIEYRAFTK